MWNLARSTGALLITSLALAPGAFAQEEEGEVVESEFVRTGFYLGVGGTMAFPSGWNGDYDNDLNAQASQDANATAQANLEEVQPNGKIIPLEVTIKGADLEDPLFGVNGVIGYRAGSAVAFEAEGEWLISDDKSNLKVNTLSFPLPPPPGRFARGSSTGSHSVEVEKVWTVTANAKVYPPFEIFTGRFQPFAKVGLGVQNSEVVTNIRTTGLSTTNEQETITLPANFQIRSTKKKLDGALRVGGGIDIYATQNVVSELNVAYVVPFAKVGSMRTDYVSLQWRLVYRF